MARLLEVMNIEKDMRKTSLMIGIIYLSCCHLESQAQAAYSTFVSGFKSKLNYFIRTIPGISQFLYPLEETVRNKFVSTITRGHICSNNKRRLLSLPTRYGRLAIPIFYELAETEFKNFRKIMSELTPLISKQSI